MAQTKAQKEAPPMTVMMVLVMMCDKGRVS
jgi:hypothetical protein